MTNQAHAEWLRDAIKQVADKMLLHLEAKDRRISELIQAGSKVNGEICQTLGKALGYPTIHTGIVNGPTAVVSSDYPGAVATDDVCVGDHVAETLAAEAAQTIAALTAERDRLREALLFYAGGRNVVFSEHMDEWVVYDHGEIARAALKGETG